jgi:serine/alanine adding enzyme
MFCFIPAFSRFQYATMKDMNHVVIKRISDSEAWDQYVKNDPGSDFCHLFHWSTVIENVYHHRPIYLAAVESIGNKQSVCGILPMFLFKSLTRMPKFVAIPFFDNGKILGQTPEIESMLFHKGASLLKESRCSILEIRQDTPSVFPDSRLPEKLCSEVATLKVGMKLRLGSTQQEMMQQFKSKLRSQINKGLKNGLEARVGKEEFIAPFYEVFSRNMRDLGSPVHSKKFFESIFIHFKDHAFICIVNYKSRPVAAGFMFRFKKEIKNPWSSSIKEFRHLNSNMLLYWEMIRFACDTGQTCFDMGRSSRGASTYRFKKQWGPEERQLYWYKWFFDTEKFKEKAETLNFRYWDRFPLKAANFFGPLVRRNISL